MQKLHFDLVEKYSFYADNVFFVYIRDSFEVGIQPENNPNEKNLF